MRIIVRSSVPTVSITCSFEYGIFSKEFWNYLYHHCPDHVCNPSYSYSYFESILVSFPAMETKSLLRSHLHLVSLYLCVDIEIFKGSVKHPLIVVVLFISDY